MIKAYIVYKKKSMYKLNKTTKIHRFNLIVPTATNYSEQYFKMLVTKLERVSQYDPTSMISLYSDIIKHPYSMYLHVSTIMFKMSDIRRCLAEYEGKLEQYQDEDDTITTVRSIRVTTSSDEMADQIKRIEIDVQRQFNDINPYMPEEMVDMRLSAKLAFESFQNRDEEAIEARIDEIIENSVKKMKAKMNIVNVASVDDNDVKPKMIEIESNETEQPILEAEYQWINSIDNEKHYDKAYNHYVLLKGLTSNNSDYKKLRNSYKNALNYYSKKYKVKPSNKA